MTEGEDTGDIRRGVCGDWGARHWRRVKAKVKTDPGDNWPGESVREYISNGNDEKRCKRCLTEASEGEEFILQKADTDAILRGANGEGGLHIQLENRRLR